MIVLRRVINCSVFHKFIYNSFTNLLIFTIRNLYVWAGIFSLISVTYFILLVYDKLTKKLEKEYLKSENITKFSKIFQFVFFYGIIKLTNVFVILNFWINNIIY